MTVAYQALMDVLTTRMSVRKFRPDPLPEGAVDKILEAGRWAMSGANGQPWEYIVVTDPSVKKAIHDHYRHVDDEYSFWMEQMRAPDLCHPAFRYTGSVEERLSRHMARPGFD